MKVGIRVKRREAKTRGYDFVLSSNVKIYGIDDLGNEASIEGVTKVEIHPLEVGGLATATIHLNLAELDLEEFEAEFKARGNKK